MTWRMPTVLAILVLGACSLDNEPPESFANPNPGQGNQPQSPDGVVRRPLIDPSDSEGRICTDEGPVQGRAQPGSTVVAQGPGGNATAQAGADGRFCVAVPLARGQQNRIEVYSVHPDHGNSEVEAISLTHAGMGCPDSAGAVPQDDPQPVAQPAERLARFLQVQASEPAKEGSDRAMVDGDPDTYVRYQAHSWMFWQARSDEMWIWLTISSLDRIKGIRIHWRDSIGQGNMYAEKFYVGVSAAESPGIPPAPPTSTFLFDPDPAPASTDWQYISRQASMNSGGGAHEIDLGSQLPVAQHIALWLEADAVDAWLAENFAISEIEVVLHTPAATRVTPPPTGSLGVCGAY